MNILIKKMLRMKMMMFNIKDSLAKTVTFLTMQIQFPIEKEVESQDKKKYQIVKNNQMADIDKTNIQPEVETESVINKILKIQMTKKQT